MNFLEKTLLDNLINHIQSYFKVKASICKNELITNNSDAKAFFKSFTINNCKLELKICDSLKLLFKRSDFKCYFQAKNRVITSLFGNFLYIEGYKTYAEMTYNDLLIYHQWDKINTSIILSSEELVQLKLYCNRENIRLDEDFTTSSKKLLLDILEKADGIEVVSVSKKSKSCAISQNLNIIDLSKEDEESQIIDLTDMNDLSNTFQEEMKPTSSFTIPLNTEKGLRPIILDGNNIAFSHGCGEFQAKGIQIAIDYFIKLGHQIVYALIPRHRQVDGGNIFEKLEKSKNLIYTPSRIVNNKRETSYDDKLILEAALGHGGVVISNDQFRDLLHIDRFKDIIINRLIPYTFVGDLFMIPEDPKGQLGPHLSTILSFNAPKSGQHTTRSHRRKSSVKKLSSLKKPNNRRMEYRRKFFLKNQNTSVITPKRL